LPTDEGDQFEVTISPHVPVIDTGVGQASAGDATPSLHHAIVHVEEVTEVNPAHDSINSPSYFPSDGGDQVVSLRAPGVRAVDERVGSIRPDSEFKAQLSQLLQNRGEFGKFTNLWACISGYKV
jgi:hypothetical protein